MAASTTTGTTQPQGESAAPRSWEIVTPRGGYEFQKTREEWARFFANRGIAGPRTNRIAGLLAQPDLSDKQRRRLTRLLGEVIQDTRNRVHNPDDEWERENRNILRTSLDILRGLRTQAQIGLGRGASEGDLQAGNQNAARADNVPGGGGGTGAGGGGGGQNAGAGGAGALPAPEVIDDRPLDQWVREEFPTFGWLIEDPEMRGLFDRARQLGWGVNQFTAGLLETKWWQNHSATHRQWQAMRATDPQSARQQLDAQAAVIGDAAAQLGLDLRQGAVRRIAERSLKFGWNDEQIRDRLVRRLDLDAPLGGAAAVTQDSLRALTQEYAVKLPDAQLDRWTRQILNGELTPEAFTSYLREQAESLFPSMRAALDKGTTVRQYAAPYLQLAAEDLGISPEDIDLTDPKWMRLLVRPGPGGERMAMDLYEARQEIRTNPIYGFRNTTKGRELGSEMADRLLSIFGERA